jgi:hypothetical protein
MNVLPHAVSCGALNTGSRRAPAVRGLGQASAPKTIATNKRSENGAAPAGRTDLSVVRVRRAASTCLFSFSSEDCRRPLCTADHAAPCRPIPHLSLYILTSPSPPLSMAAPSAVVAASSASPTLFSRRPTSWKTKRVARSSSNINTIRHANSSRNIIRAAASNDSSQTDALPQAGAYTCSLFSST